MSAKEATTDSSGSNRRRSNGPKAGSVWESRMKLDRVSGGIKVFDKSISSEEENALQNTVLTSNESPAGIDNSNNSEPDEMENKKMRNVTPKQSPTGANAKRKTWNKSEDSDSSPLQLVRQRSELAKNSDKVLSFSPDGMKKNSPLRKSRSVSSPRKAISEKVKSDCNEAMSDRSLKPTAVVEDIEGLNEPNKESDSIEALRSDEECKELVLFEDKTVPSDEVQVKNKSDANDDDVIEVEIKSADVKEINVQEQKQKKALTHRNEKPLPVSPIVKKTKASNQGRIHPSPVKIKPVSDDHIHGTPSKTSKLKSFVDLIMWRDVSKSAFIFGIGTFAIISSSYTKDLNISFISVVSYLGLVYLAAIFLFRSLISSRRSLNVTENIDQDCVIGEDEAIWVMKLFLPYLNEFLLKLRALFSGDPATTMKLSVLLFVLARCGSSITIWKMAKLGFIGVFTVPKICSSYSSQLTAYGTFWIRRFRDVWDSCSHKKAVGFAAFTLVWNLSSLLARIWAVFMLFVAFKYYQHSSSVRS